MNGNLLINSFSLPPFQLGPTSQVHAFARWCYTPIKTCVHIRTYGTYYFQCIVYMLLLLLLLLLLPHIIHQSPNLTRFDMWPFRNANRWNAWGIGLQGDSLFAPSAFENMWLNVQEASASASVKFRRLTKGMSQQNKVKLGDGLKCCLFSPLLRGRLPIWQYIFEVGWHHKLGNQQMILKERLF